MNVQEKLDKCLPNLFTALEILSRDRCFCIMFLPLVSWFALVRGNDLDLPAELFILLIIWNSIIQYVMLDRKIYLVDNKSSILISFVTLANNKNTNKSKYNY